MTNTKSVKKKPAKRVMRVRRGISDETRKRWEHQDALRGIIIDVFSEIALDDHQPFEKRVAAAKIVVGGGCC